MKQRASKQRVENTIDFIQSLTLENAEKIISESEQKVIDNVDENVDENVDNVTENNDND